MIEPLALSTIEKGLRRKGTEPAGDLAWLKDSYENPSGFWTSLAAALDLFLPWPRKSIPFEKYNFFHDIVVRNRMSAAPAFRWYQAGSGWREASFPELGAFAGAMAAHWAKTGVEAGSKVCLVYPMGIRFAASLLAALKLGAVVSILPPEGRGFLNRRLETLEPDYIAIEQIHLSLIPQWLGRVIGEEKGGRPSDGVMEGSFTYTAGSPVAMLFDPSSEDLLTPRELTADAGYLCALRDGLLALGLRPGSAFAAPGFDLLGCQPAMLLACLLTGATYVHLELEQIAHDPGLVGAHPLRAIGVSARVRNILLDNPVDLSQSWTLWLREIAETYDLELWQSFAESMGLTGLDCGNLRWNPSLGGCILFSIRRTGLPTMNVLPSAGVSWELSGDLAGDAGSAMGAGVFSPVSIGGGAPETVLTSDLIVERRGEWMYAGSLAPGRCGRVYPAPEVVEAVRTMPQCRRVAIVDNRAMGGMGRLFTLLIFSGDQPPADQAGICKAMERAVTREMGEQYLPDHIRFFPLYPRRDKKGEIDGEWCRSQYMKGGLSRKSRGEVYRCLTRLRRYLND